MDCKWLLRFDEHAGAGFRLRGSAAGVNTESLDAFQPAEKMAYWFEFDSRNQVLNCSFKDRVSDEELTEYYEVATRCVEQIKPRAAIVDFSDVSDFDVSPGTLRRLASRPPVMPNPAQPRVVVAPRPDIYGLARIFQIEGEATRPSFHVVRTLQEACTILGVHTFEFAPIQTPLNHTA